MNASWLDQYDSCLLTSIFQNGLANKCGAVGVVHATGEWETYYETIWIEKL